MKNHLKMLGLALAVKVGKGSAMLLRVNGSGPDEAHPCTTPCRRIGE